MSYVRVLIHAVFSTKNREIVLHNEEKNLLCEHIREETRKKSIRLLAVNGYFDHLHCLISLGPTQSIADIMQSIKGESAYWFNNKSGLAGFGKLIWQDDYFAASVKESHAKAVSEYIQNQEQHHQGVSFYQETERMAEKYGFELRLDRSSAKVPSAKSIVRHTDGNE